MPSPRPLFVNPITDRLLSIFSLRLTPGAPGRRITCTSLISRLGTPSAGVIMLARSSRSGRTSRDGQSGIGSPVVFTGVSRCLSFRFSPLILPHVHRTPGGNTEHFPSLYSLAAGIYTDRGSYAEYLKTESDLAWHIPASMSDTDAATYGIGAVAAMQGLFLNLDVAWPDGQKEEGQNGQVDPGRTVSFLRQSSLLCLCVLPAGVNTLT